MSKLDAKVFSSITPFSKQWVDLTPRFNVDLGSLTWYKRTEEGFGTYFYADITSWGIEYIGRYQFVVYPIYCSKYSATTRVGLATEDKVMCCDGSIGTVSQLQIKDSNFTGTAAQFKQYIKGTELVYAKTDTFNMYEFLNQYQDFLSDSYGIVDLGSLDYIIEVSQDKNIFYAAVPLALGNFNIYGNNQYCSEYVNAPESTTRWPEYSCCRFGASSANINIYDTEKQSYTVEQFKAAMSGVYLVYRLTDGVKRKSYIFNKANQDNIAYFGLYSDLQALYINRGDTEYIAAANIYLTSSNSNWVYKRYDEIDHSYRLQHGSGPTETENIGRAYVFVNAPSEAAAREIINNDPVIVYCYYKQS